MAPEKKPKTYRVYNYGCLAPVSGQDDMFREFELRTKYWNTLVEIEREHREKTFELLHIPGDETVEAKEAEVAAIRESINAKRKDERANVPADELRQRIKEFQAQLKTLRKENKAARKKAVEENRDKLDELELERRQKVKDARGASGLYWGNYGDIEDSYNVARRKAMQHGIQLRFQRHDGTGKLSVRWQQGLPVENVFDGSNNLLQIEPVSEDAWNSPTRSIRRKAARTVARIRIRSAEKLAPVWAELPMVMHRPLPADGQVRSASLVCNAVAGKPSYRLTVTVALPCHMVIEEGANLGKLPAVGIDIGWRLKDDESIRTAYWCDEDGRHGEVLLSALAVREFLKLDDLRSIRDQRTNELKAALSGFFSGNDTTPDLLKDDTKHLAKWRSPRRFLELFDLWSDNRFPDDEAAFELLEQWRKKEQHLYSWEANLRDQVRRRRREEYRVFAAWLAKNYSQVFMEKFDLSRISKLQKPEDGVAVTLPPSKFRNITSPGIFRLQVENACKREGVIVRRLSGKHTTAECHVCGHTEKWAAGAKIMRECPVCSVEWDQDHNAAILLLRRGLAASEDERVLAAGE